MSDVTWNPAGDDDTSFGPLTAHNVLGGRTAADAHPATAVSYDNDVSGLAGDTVQEAIDELATTGGGAVSSVNGETGVVVLDAADVGAVPVARTITAGTGLTGGGDLSADRTLTVSFGATAGTAAEGNDARLTDARTPTAHAASHQDGGSDELALDGSQITTGTVAAARLGSGTASVSTVLHGDGVWRRALPLSRPNVQYEYRTLAGGTTSSTLAANELMAAGKLNSHPVFLRAGTYDRIGVFTTVAGTSTYRLGVYPSFDDRLEPDGSALLIDCGVIDVSAAPGLLLRTATITIPYDGVWHFAVLCETYTSRPTIHGWAGGTSLPLFPFQGVFFYGFPVGRAAFGRVATGVATGAMPATFPAATHSDTLPQIVARCA